MISLCHLSGARPYSLSLVFLFSGSFVEVVLLSILRMVSSILLEEEPRCLSIWWDFCYIVLFRVVFLFSKDTLFFFCFFRSCLLVWWCLLPIVSGICKFPFFFSFLGGVCVLIFLDLVVLFLPSYVIFRFSFFWVLLWVNWTEFSVYDILVALFPCCWFILLFCYVLFVPIFCSKIVLFFIIRSLVRLQASSPYLLVEFSFVVLECSVLSVLFDPVSVSVKSSFFRYYLIIYLIELDCLF